MNESLKELAVRYFEGPIAPEEECELFGFLAASPENAALMREWEREWKQRHVPSADVLRSLARLNGKIERRENRIRARRRWLRFSAAAAVLILISAFTTRHLIHTEDPVQMFSVQAPQGTNSRISLPDGSQVWLNAGSTLNYRVASVLGRIGLAWMFASLLYMYCKVRTRAVFAAVVLIGYSLLMYLVVAPDAPDGTDPLSVAGNIAGWVDRQWLPGTFACGSFDPEGLLSTLPAIVSALFGMFTGEFLLRKRSSLSGEQIALCMALAAVAITVIGIIWNCWIPINKKLWSSSFTCVVTGYSLGLFALFYYLIDVRGWKRWTFFFRVIGLNSITIYLAQRIVGFGGIANFFFGGAASHCPEAIARVISNAGYVAICWLFLYFLYRKSTFLKV